LMIGVRWKCSSQYALSPTIK